LAIEIVIKKKTNSFKEPVYYFKGINENNKVIGFMTLESIGLDFEGIPGYLLNNFFIKPNFRGKGFSKFFLEKLNDFVKNKLKKDVLIEPLPYRISREEPPLDKNALTNLYKKYLSDSHFIVVDN
jgi:GNAT superfamily N-acetyltransferase